MKLRTLAAVLVVAVAPARADDEALYEPPDFLRDPPPLPARIDPATAWRLSLTDALTLAMRNNLDVVLEREQVMIQSLGVALAHGKFEPLLQAQYGYASQVTPPTGITAIATFGGSLMPYTTVNDNWNLQLSDQLTTGTQLSVGTFNGRAASNAGFGVPPVFYSTSVVATVTQPLLRSFSSDLVIPRLDMLRAELTSERERAQLAIQAATVIQQTEAAYWDVVGALYSDDLAAKSLQRASDQLELTNRQIQAGLNPPSDLVAAQSTLAQRQLAVLDAEQKVDASWDQLRAQLNLPREQWARPILPMDVPGFVPDRTTPEAALQTAIHNRPELAQYELDIKNEVLALRQAENNKLPEIDLQLSAGLSGEQPTYWSALDEQFAKRDAPAYTLGVNLVWTPLMRQTWIAAEQERTRMSVVRIRRDKGIQDIWAGVREAVRQLGSAERKVYAAKRSRELAAQTLELEQRRYLNGQTQIIAIAQRQEELASAQVAELDAVVAHRKASTQLLLATGKLLEARNIQLAVRQ
jgi:outer membrane protein